MSQQSGRSLTRRHRDTSRSLPHLNFHEQIKQTRMFWATHWKVLAQDQQFHLVCSPIHSPELGPFLPSFAAFRVLSSPTICRANRPFSQCLRTLPSHPCVSLIPSFGNSQWLTFSPQYNDVPPSLPSHIALQQGLILQATGKNNIYHSTTLRLIGVDGIFSTASQL